MHLSRGEVGPPEKLHLPPQLEPAGRQLVVVLPTETCQRGALEQRVRTTVAVPAHGLGVRLSESPRSVSGAGLKECATLPPGSAASSTAPR